MGRLPRLIQTSGFPVCRGSGVANIILYFRSMRGVRSPLLGRVRTTIASRRANFLGCQNVIVTNLHCTSACHLRKSSCATTLVSMPRFSTVNLACNPRFHRRLHRGVAIVLGRCLPRSLAVSRVNDDYFLLFRGAARVTRLRRTLVRVSGTVRTVRRMSNFPYALCVRCTVIRKTRTHDLSDLLRLLVGHVRRSRRTGCKRTLCADSHFVFGQRTFSDSRLNIIISSLRACRLLCYGPAVHGHDKVPLSTPLGKQGYCRVVTNLSTPYTSYYRPRLDHDHFASQVFRGPMTNVSFLLQSVLVP